MATTTNYSWSTPDDTALVKDGAAAIRSLGTAIDTTVFNNAGAAIAKTIVDAKGDIIAATAADTVSRLAVGANNTVLTADSSTATGLKWATVAAGGITQLATGSLNGVSTVTISSISQSYKNLVLYIQNVQGPGGSLGIRPNNFTTANSYLQVYNKINASTWTSATYNSFYNFTDSASNTNETVLFTIPNYTTTGLKSVTLQGAGGATDRNVILFGRNTDVDAVTSLVIFNGDSNNYTSGTYTLFGVS